MRRGFAQKRLVLTVAIVLSALGAFAFGVMPRAEDPRMPATWGLVIAALPGADAGKVERLVLDPLEKALLRVESIQRLESTAQPGVALVNLEMASNANVDRVWNDVEDALDDARSEFPDDALPPVLDRKLNDTQAVIVALTGSQDVLELSRVARELESALLAVPGVARVELSGVVDERVVVTYDPAIAASLGLDARSLAGMLGARHRPGSSGAITAGKRTISLLPNAEFESIEQIAATPVVLPSGAAVALGDLATVRREVPQPELERMRHDGKPAVAVGIVPRPAENVVAFGERIRRELAKLRVGIEPLAIEEIAFQPERVEQRLSGLSRSLLLGILIVAAVLVAFMGLRLGLIVAFVVPLVAASSLGLFAMGGGVLHQISIAALVLALGMLVDNAIVVAEDCQRRLDLGEDRQAATQAAVRSLALPLATATGTTVAAFLPMLLSEGPTADFTRSIPIIVIITLVLSYLFAIAVTPALAAMVLRPRVAARDTRVASSSSLLGRFALRHPWAVVGLASALLVATALSAGSIEQRFFPGADRNQLVVSVSLQEGSPIEASDDARRRLEALLARRPEVVSIDTFVGRAVPRFYYNILSSPSSPHLAQLLITTREASDTGPLADWIRVQVRERIPEAQVVARAMEQGPPVTAPIEVRVTGKDLVNLQEASERVLRELRELPGTRDVRHDLGAGMPTVQFAIDDTAAARRGLARRDVSLALLEQTQGLPVGELRYGAELVPILVRGPDAHHLAPSDVASVPVTGDSTGPVPLEQLAMGELRYVPAVAHHLDGKRVARVLAELAPGVPFSLVEKQLAERLKRMALPAGVEVALGGASEESGEANRAMLKTLPAGLLLLLVLLLVEFNSFRRLAIVLTTMPLAATGVVPGLVLADQPFGFMSMLGVFALLGIVVNNAIVLLDVIEQRRRSGATLEEAVQDAVTRRTRPILLTTATTIAGLLPLAFSGSSLWPPLAWAMISGLTASTLLTLGVVPALYALLFRGGQAGSPPHAELGSRWQFWRSARLPEPS